MTGNRPSGTGQDFDRWLASELDQGFAALTALTVPPVPRYVARTSRFGLPPNLSASRLFAPMMAAALIAGGGTAAAAATGTNPVEFGQQVSWAAITCKEHLARGERGVGDCVSDFVQARLADPDHAGPASVGRTSGPSPNAEGGRPSDRATRSAGPEGNHGATVSDVAHSTPPGPEHGEAVSEAARSNSRGRSDERPESGPNRASEAAIRSNEGSGQRLGQTDAGPARGNSPSALPTATPTPTPTTAESVDLPGNSESGPGRRRSSGPNR